MILLGNFIRKLTLPSGVPSELEVIMKGRRCGQGDGTGQLVVKRGTNTIYNRELQASAHACGQYTVNHIFTDFQEGDTLEFFMKENNGSGAVDGDPQVQNFTDGGNKQRGSITIKALNSLEVAGVTNVVKGQTLETIAGVCDGRTVVGQSGSYTWPTGTQHIPSTSYVNLNGSVISFISLFISYTIIYSFFR